MPYLRTRRVPKGYIILSIVMLALVLALSACGRKANPSSPDDSTYPGSYPTE